jgi:hypothetical protein
VRTNIAGFSLHELQCAIRSSLPLDLAGIPIAIDHDHAVRDSQGDVRNAVAGPPEINPAPPIVMDGALMDTGRG